MKRFLLFEFESYYPSGGWEDFTGSFETLEEAVGEANGENAHVVDAESSEIVAYRDCDEPWESGKR